MGGIDRHGAMATGTQEEIQTLVQGILADIPETYILGADCTLPGNIDWDNIKTAIATAHEFKIITLHIKCICLSEIHQYKVKKEIKQ